MSTFVSTMSISCSLYQTSLPFFIGIYISISYIYSNKYYQYGECSSLKYCARNYIPFNKYILKIWIYCGKHPLLLFLIFVSLCPFCRQPTPDTFHWESNCYFQKDTSFSFIHLLQLHSLTFFRYYFRIFVYCIMRNL